MKKFTDFFSPLNKQNVAWAFYDWANSAFATTIMAAFFPIFFKQYWSYGVDVSKSTFLLGLSNSASGLFIATLSPVLGALADQTSLKNKFLMLFTFLGALGSIGLYFVSKGDWLFAIIFYVLGAIGYGAGLTFYDSLLLKVSKPKTIDFVSSFGFAIGYLGGALLFVLNVVMFSHYEAFGLSSSSEAIRVSFVMVGLWWLTFSIPVFLFVKEEKMILNKSFGQLIKSSFFEVFRTFREVKKYKPIFFFLLAYFFYIDGVNTTIKMAVDYGMSIGIETSTLIKAILIVNFSAFPTTLIFLTLTKNLGSQKGILVGLFIYCCIIISAYFMKTSTHFLLLAFAIGCVQGGVQALSRSHFGKMVPPSRSSEFFGFYNMLGKFSSVLGPLLMGVVSLWSQDPRLSILSLLLLFGVGGYFLVNNKRLSS